MAKRAQNSNGSTRNPWVPAGLSVANSRKSAGKSAGVDEWLPAPNSGSNGHKSGSNGHNGHAGVSGGGNGFGGLKPDDAPGPAKTRPRRRHKLPKRATPRERWLILRLRRSKRRVEEQQEQIDQLKRRLSELEATAADRGRNGDEPTPTTDRKPKRPATAPRARGARSPSGSPTKRTRSRNGGTRKKSTKLDLNRATFDQLRGLGLSITQTSRLISRRETDGGFASVDDLQEIPGLARATVTKLRSQVRVAAR
jgi:hypothetical protein